jgi:uncharacterized membrane protein
MRMRSILLVALVFTATAAPLFAQELREHTVGIWRARVVEITDERREKLPGTDASITIQEMRAELLEGSRKGEIIELTNDYVSLEAGDYFFISYLVDTDGREIFDIQEPDRRRGMIVLATLFVVVVVVFGGWQGVRALTGLAVTLAVLIFFLFEHLVKGEAIVWWASAYAFLASTLALVITHGFSRQTAAALFGIAGAVIITACIALFGIDLLNLSGFYADESLYLNLDTGGSIDFTSLLLAAIIIGTLGVLDDVTSTQASAVAELIAANPSLSGRGLFKKAMAIGRTHVSALVNTLALAYAGTALPFLLLVYMASSSSIFLLNKEVFATEVLRVVASSIGLICAVPLSTIGAVFLARRG